MKQFEFSLEQIRDYKKQVLDRENKTLSSLKARRNEICEKIISLGKYRDEKIAQMQQRQVKGVSLGEISSMSFLIENTRKQIKALQAELCRAEEMVEAQRGVVLSVYQEKTGMDKLEEKQMEEHRLFEAKAAEGEVMQAVANRMARKSTA